MRKKHHYKKKNYSKKWYGRLHLWLGLSTGIIIFIVSLSGTLYVFKDEVQNSLRKKAIYVKNKDLGKKPLSINLLCEKVLRETNEKYPLSTVEIPLDKRKSYRFLYYEKSKKGWNYFQQVLINKQIYVNQYTGEILGVYNEKYDIFNILKYIHWGLLLNSEWGPYTIGIPTVIFIIILITGIILWWPKNKNARKGRFWFSWENVKNWKRKNYDLHNILGFYASFIAIIMGITGIYFSYPYVKKTFNLALSGYWETPKEKEIKSPDSLMVKNHAIFDLALAQTEQLYTKSSCFRINLNGKNKKGKELKNLSVTVYGQDGRYSERNTLTFDKYSGRLLSQKPHYKLSLAEKYANANYDIHTGSYFGLPGKIIWFTVGLICTSLPVTGFMIWWGRKKKKVRNTFFIKITPF